VRKCLELRISCWVESCCICDKNQSRDSSASYKLSSTYHRVFSAVFNACSSPSTSRTDKIEQPLIRFGGLVLLGGGGASSWPDRSQAGMLPPAVVRCWRRHGVGVLCGGRGLHAWGTCDRSRPHPNFIASQTSTTSLHLISRWAP
jgi:hypothetical protein